MKFDQYIYDSQFLSIIEPNLLDNSFENDIKNYKKNIINKSLEFYTKYEDWDSNYFNRNISRVVWIKDNIDSIGKFKIFINSLKEFDCYYFRLNQNHSFCKYANLFSLNNKLLNCSIKISFLLKLGNIKNHYGSDINVEINNIEQLSDETINQIVDISRNAFIYNRFLRDPNFKQWNINNLYEKWLISSLRMNNFKLFSVLENEVSSFLLYNENINPVKNNKKIGFISLIATKPEYKNKKHASSLLYYCLKNAKDNDTKYVIANSDLMNIPAINFFIINGFKINSVLKEYHYWNVK